MNVEDQTCSIRICQEGHANALDLNKANTQIAIAGRSLLKVYSIESDGFTEVCNMRGGKNPNLSYSSNDVSWSHIDTNILATAATNGVVAVWDLTKFGRQKQTLSYNDHERTAHTVEFHLVDPNVLVSASQDGTIKYFDLRTDKGSVATFHSNSESIRDVKFNALSPNVLAAVSENGSVSMWDIKRPDRCLQQFTAHSGPIYTCDFHPTNHWLATGSRDKQIKIWNIQSKPVLEYTIHTIAVVGRVKWRPEKPFQIASCALVFDYSIYIWDIRRPYIPFASFNEHSNVTTDIGFKTNDPNILLSTSKDSTIYKHCFKDAILPYMTANPQSTTINLKGELLFAQRHNQPTLEIVNAPSKGSPMSGRSFPELHGVFHMTRSNLYKMSNRPNKEPIALPIEELLLDLDYNFTLHCAKEYIIRGDFQDICRHNGNVARKYKKQSTATLWQLIGYLFDIYSKTSIGTTKKNETVTNKNHLNSKQQLTDDKKDHFSNNHSREERVLAPLPLRTGQETASTVQIPNNSESTDIDVVFGNTEINFENMDFVHGFRKGFLYMGTYQHDTNLTTSGGTDSNSPLQIPQRQSESESDSLISYEMPPQILQVNHNGEHLYLWDPFEMVKSFLLTEAENGDIQTVASLVLALQDKRFDMLIEEDLQEFWIMSYIELLHRYQLWNVATNIMNNCSIPAVQEVNQQSTSVVTACGTCNRNLGKTPSFCEKCKSSKSAQCAYCRLPVRGVYVSCITCCHGGHLEHMYEWFKYNSKCPVCAHLCEYE